ncbi:MAG TPA: cytochrome c peroxidase [Myxococcales bacterium]
MNANEITSPGRRRSPRRSLLAGATFAVAIALLLSSGAASAANLTAPPSLKHTPVPEPSNLGDYVKDKKAAITLGKALFWDMQVGSDGMQACATCHFHAGADHRVKNQVNPGQAGGDNTFQLTPGPNATVSASDFPFHRYSSVNDRFSAVLQDVNDVMGSEGVFDTQFVGVVRGSAAEQGNPVADPVFHVGSTNVRRITGRNAPSVINAVFNYNNFWDGRANFVFNGVDPFGDANLNARIFSNDGKGALQAVAAHIEDASLASQAVGPPGSDTEMSYTRRTFPDIGKKLLGLRPLGKQLVNATDGVLGTSSRNSRSARPGLSRTYASMIKAAFQDWSWNVTGQVVTFDSTGYHLVPKPPRLAANQYTQMEANFSLFFGLAIQLYEATLVSDDTPFDRFQDGDCTALSTSAQQGLNLFFTPVDQGFAGGGCFNCHAGAEFTKATVSNVGRTQFIEDIPERIVERMAMGDGGGAFYDAGFYNIGVRPTEEDIGRGGSDPFGYPLSYTARALMIDNGTALPFSNPPLNCGDGQPTPCPQQRSAIDGTFKAPTLRNVELTGPYFHNGGQATLMQVIDFYTRGGDFHENNIKNLDSDMETIDGMTDVAKTELVDFLMSLTDERVRWEKAPFDHPELFLTSGSPGDSSAVTCSNPGTCDEVIHLPAVGAQGRAAAGLPALETFLALDPHAH